MIILWMCRYQWDIRIGSSYTNININSEQNVRLMVIWMQHQWYRCYYCWTGGAIGRLDAFTLDMALLGPSKTCFCCVRCTSSICTRSISNNIGANKIADELKNTHAAEHEYTYNPTKHQNVSLIYNVTLNIWN